MPARCAQVATAWTLTSSQQGVAALGAGDTIGVAFDQGDYPVQLYFYRDGKVVHQLSGIRGEVLAVFSVSDGAVLEPNFGGKPYLQARHHTTAAKCTPRASVPLVRCSSAIMTRLPRLSRCAGYATRLPGHHQEHVTLVRARGRQRPPASVRSGVRGLRCQGCMHTWKDLERRAPKWLKQQRWAHGKSWPTG